MSSKQNHRRGGHNNDCSHWYKRGYYTLHWNSPAATKIGFGKLGIVKSNKTLEDSKCFRVSIQGQEWIHLNKISVCKK